MIHAPWTKTVAQAIAVAAMFAAQPALAADAIVVPMHKVSAEGVGEAIGKIEISGKDGGISLNINVKGIAAGPHGFHLHEKGSCEAGEKDGKKVAALGAGGHYDPAGAKAHKGPHGDGHKGDLPVLTATDAGITAVVTAEHVTLDDVKGRALVIHEGGDNYTDEPANGGGAGRIACGVIPQ